MKSFQVQNNTHLERKICTHTKLLEQDLGIGHLRIPSMNSQVECPGDLHNQRYMFYKFVCQHSVGIHPRGKEYTLA